MAKFKKARVEIQAAGRREAGTGLLLWLKADAGK
jgi:hypothetical protein